ncbi:succinylglutamate desuccinylase/aspartoacylase family protein [Yunchengibacter salinarum]|uniref:succinylglutamate desuccinylase/aspartoacylase family protein n=1 Tax=Yunchengibacter salinarum TaxID=3133399 RepID=UPI0035B6021E
MTNTGKGGRRARAPFEIEGESIPPGTHRSLTLDLPGMSQHTPLSMPVHVVHGRKDGPVLWVSAAIHGDEINGIDIIRQLLRMKTLGRLRGTLICIPVVNVHGFYNHERYLPDRRDLNRAFPGSEHGSLASRMAYTFRTRIVDRADVGIDLHTGSNHRTNLPHIRANMDDADAARLARAFGAPVVVDAKLRDGSLRGYANERQIPTLLYEAGESLRFDPLAIRGGVRGVLNVMVELDMLPRSRGPRGRHHAPIEARSSHWLRAPQTGILRPSVQPGTRVQPGDTLAHLGDLMGSGDVTMEAVREGVVIGQNLMPMVNEGDACFHIAEFSNAARAERSVETFSETLEGLGEGDYPDSGFPD